MDNNEQLNNQNLNPSRHKSRKLITWIVIILIIIIILMFIFNLAYNNGSYLINS